MITYKDKSKKTLNNKTKCLTRSITTINKNNNSSLISEWKMESI